MLTIFDIDGTLTETFVVDEDCFLESVEHVLVVSNVDTDWDKYQHVTDSGLAEEISVRYRGKSISEVEMQELEHFFVGLLKKQDRESFQQIRGAASFIDTLREHGMNQIAFATGGWRRSAELKLRNAGICYDGIPLVTALEAISREEIMKLAADAVGRGEDSQVCYFGDGTWDVKATQNLGWHFIGMGARICKLKALGVQHTFPDYSEPDKVLRVLNGFDAGI